MKQVIPFEVVEKRIFTLRGERVILDRDLAGLYGVTTSQLNQSVSRNPERFPTDFVFRLTDDEIENIVPDLAGSESRGGIRKPPRAFTEQGVAMLSSVLRSKQAVQVNILIMRAFIKMREMVLGYNEFARKLNDLERKYEKHDVELKMVFDAIRKLAEPPKVTGKARIGFRTSQDENEETKTRARKK